MAGPASLAGVRKAALMALIFGLLSLPLPLWRAAASLTATVSNRPEWKAWIVLALIVAALFTAVLPVFLFTLYRNQGALHVPRGLGRLSLAGAIALGAVVLLNLARSPGSLSPRLEALRGVDWRSGGSAFSAAIRQSATAGILSDALSLLSDASYIALLVAISRYGAGSSDSETRASNALILAARSAAFALGVWGAFSAARALLAPTAYESLREAVPPGRLPSLTRYAWEPVSDLVVAAGLWIAPFVIYRSASPFRTRREPANPINWDDPSGE